MNNVWTQHELRAAESRSLEQDEEYILPVRLDKAPIPDTIKTIGYVSWPPETPETIADLVLAKLGKTAVVASPLSAEADSIDVHRLPKSIRIFALGAPHAGKTTFFLCLVNALMRGGRYRSADAERSSDEFSNMLWDVRKTKWPRIRSLDAQSEMGIACKTINRELFVGLKCILRSVRNTFPSMGHQDPLIKSSHSAM